MAYPSKPIITEYQIVTKTNDSWGSCMKDIVHTVQIKNQFLNTYLITGMGNLEKSNRQTNSLQYNDIAQKLEESCAELLVGKNIKSVRYMYTVEKKDVGWHKRALVIYFNDGSYIFPSANNEGNDAGAYFTSIRGMEVIPTL